MHFFTYFCLKKKKTRKEKKEAVGHRILASNSKIQVMSEDELYLKVPADFKYNLMLWCLAIVNQIKGTRLLLDSECYVYTLRLNFRKAESF